MGNCCSQQNIRKLKTGFALLDGPLQAVLSAMDNEKPDPTYVEEEKKHYHGRTRALFIGINYIGQAGELGGCINDVKTMRNILRLRAFPFANEAQDVRVLVEDEKFPNYFGQPTKENIVNGLKWLVEGCKAGDTLFLHYSGHGTSVPDQNGDEDDGKDEAMVPLDYQFAGIIRDDDIYDIVVGGMPAGARLTAVLDCCHSGTLMDLPYVNGSHETAKPNARTNLPDVVMFSGCKDEQTSADVSDTSAAFDVPQTGPGSAGGACTNAMAETLHGVKTITFVDLLKNMREKLVRRGFSQIPQLSSTKHIELNREFKLYGPLADSSGTRDIHIAQTEAPGEAPQDVDGDGIPDGYAWDEGSNMYWSDQWHNYWNHETGLYYFNDQWHAYDMATNQYVVAQ